MQVEHQRYRYETNLMKANITYGTIYLLSFAINWLHLSYAGDSIAEYLGYQLSLWLVPLIIYMLILLPFLIKNKIYLENKLLILIGLLVSFLPAILLTIAANVTGEL